MRSGINGKAPFIRLLALSTLGFALTILSNTLEPAVIGHKVLELVPDGAIPRLASPRLPD